MKNKLDERYNPIGLRVRCLVEVHGSREPKWFDGEIFQQGSKFFIKYDKEEQPDDVSNFDFDEIEPEPYNGDCWVRLGKLYEEVARYDNDFLGFPELAYRKAAHLGSDYAKDLLKKMP